MTENKQMNVAIYLRVSTDEQIKGYGLTVQEEKLKAFIKSQEYVLDEKHIYREEGFSGTLPIEARPQLKLLFEDAKNKKFDVVLVYRIDRFFRKTRLLLEAIEQLDKQKIGFRSISEAFDTTNSAGRFMTTLLGGVAEMERDTIRERTMSGKLSAARAGKWTTGVPPYGYKVNPETKKLLLVENEASVVKQFYEWIVYERLSLGKVAERANNLGINSPKHTTIKKRKTHNFWYKRTIGRLLTNEIYTGTTYFRKYKRPFNNLTSLVSSELQRPKEDWVKIIVPPVISVDLFEKAKQQLLKNREMSSRNTKRQYLYTKIIYCGACGFKMFSGFQPARKERGGVGTKYYHGTHRKKDAVGTTKRCFKCPQYAESRLEPVWDCLKEILGDPQNVLRALEKYSFKGEDKESIKNRITQNERRLMLIAEKKSKLVQVYINSDLDEESYKKQLLEYKVEEESAKAEISKFSQQLLSKNDKLDRQKFLQGLFTKIKEKLKKIDYDDRRYIISLFLDKILLFPRSNYAEVIFKFPNSLIQNRKVEIEKQPEVLFLNIKTLSEHEIRSKMIKANPLMYKKTLAHENI